MPSLRALAPSLTRITVAGAVGAALHIGQGDCDIVVKDPKTMRQHLPIEKKLVQAEDLKWNS